MVAFNGEEEEEYSEMVLVKMDDRMMEYEGEKKYMLLGGRGGNLRWKRCGLYNGVQRLCRCEICNKVRRLKFTDRKR